MDFDDYVAARYGRLIEHAVLLGCAEGEAGACVDQVLLAQRKAIRKADDPDPVVHDALERAITGRPERRGGAGPFVALGVVVLAAGVGAALTYRPPPEPMPSLFGLDGERAERLLEDEGYDVIVRQVRACEPEGLVLTSDPLAGDPVSDGATVSVRTAVTDDLLCGDQYVARRDAWSFVGFALGGDPPEFADDVTVVIDRREPYVLHGDEALDPDRWLTTFDLVTEAARQPAPTATGMPALTVDAALPPASWCGTPRPDGAGERVALRVEIDPRRRSDRRGCPLTIDLYRTSDDAIEAVVVYSAKGLGGEDGAEPDSGAVGGGAGLGHPTDPD